LFPLVDAYRVSATPSKHSPFPRKSPRLKDKREKRRAAKLAAAAEIERLAAAAAAEYARTGSFTLPDLEEEEEEKKKNKKKKVIQTKYRIYSHTSLIRKKYR